MRHIPLILIFTVLSLAALACAPPPEPASSDTSTEPSPELEAERAKVETLEAENATLSEEIDDLRAALVESEVALTDESAKTAELEGRLQAARESNEWLAAETTALQNDLANLLSSYTLAAVVRVLAPDVTEERFNSVLVEAGDNFGRAYPHSRLPEYVSLTKWTYCTIPYFDEAHHERMRQLAQERVDALNR